jgi:hypothetical protein
MNRELIDKLVDRFLSWPLPKTFAPDCGISFDGRKPDQWNPNKGWPIGTNLFTADEARAMFEHVLADTDPVAAQQQLLDVCAAAKYLIEHLPDGEYMGLGQLRMALTDASDYKRISDPAAALMQSRRTT